MPRVTLVGYRGTGKSTVAASLGGLLGCDWVDADQVLEDKLGCSIASLIRSRGEPAFRDEESIVLADALERCRGVLSTGGGVVLRSENRGALRARGRPIVWLHAPAEILAARIAADPTTPARRPSLVAGGDREGVDPLAEVTAALAARTSLYQECADVTIDTSVEPPDAVARRIAIWLEDVWPRQFPLPPGSSSGSSGAAPGRSSGGPRP